MKIMRTLRPICFILAVAVLLVACGKGTSAEEMLTKCLKTIYTAPYPLSESEPAEAEDALAADAWIVQAEKDTKYVEEHVGDFFTQKAFEKAAANTLFSAVNRICAQNGIASSVEKVEVSKTTTSERDVTGYCLLVKVKLEGTEFGKADVEIEGSADISIVDGQKKITWFKMDNAPLEAVVR